MKSSLPIQFSPPLTFLSLPSKRGMTPTFSLQHAYILIHKHRYPLRWLQFFIFCILDTLAFGVLILERLSLPEQLIPKDNTLFPWEWAFNEQTNQFRAHTPNHLLYQTLKHQANNPLALNPPGPGTRRLGTTPITLNPPKLYKLFNLKLTQGTFPASPISPHKNPSKGSEPSLPPD